jgi:hypothetical protein
LVGGGHDWVFFVFQWTDEFMDIAASERLSIDLNDQT